MHIYKIFTAPQWADMQNAGQTDGAPIDLSDGYIHLSNAAQVAETASRHFAGMGDLWLVAIEADGLDLLKWERSRNGDLFPHLYRPLRMADVLRADPLPLRDGAHDFSGLL